MSSCSGKIRKTGQLPVQTLSWNVRGLCDYHKSDSKMRQLSDFLDQYFEWDFFLAQEHKLDDAKLKEAKRLYLPGHQTFWAAADETRGGVAISVRAGRGIEVLNHGKDNEGRFVWITVKMGSRTFGVCNVYAPCVERERKALWRRMQVQLDIQLKWVVGGDYNFIEETCDKFGGVPAYVKHVSLEWHDFRDLHMLMCDP